MNYAASRPSATVMLCAVTVTYDVSKDAQFAIMIIMLQVKKYFCNNYYNILIIINKLTKMLSPMGSCRHFIKAPSNIFPSWVTLIVFAAVLQQMCLRNGQE